MSPPGYPAHVMEAVRRFHERHPELSAYRLRKLLAAQGLDPLPAEVTIMRWVDPDYADRERQARRRGGLGEVKLQRMRDLRDAGLSATDVARVMELDFGERLHRMQVDRWLEAGEWAPRRGPKRGKRPVDAIR